MTMPRLALVALILTLSYQAEAHQAVDRRLLLSLPPDTSTPAEIADRPGQIRRGRDLFLNETFGGNGRTCGTCHEPTRNFTIDPAFIATLPPTSPLFVAERVPALAGLENPTLMRQFGLILENLDGFQNPGVMRGVPHTFALPLSIKPEPGTLTQPGTTVDLTHATGWSGDGSPNDGSIRSFALGAVVQHFTKDLLRRPGIDFRLPTRRQLRQMEAFQLSLGRRVDIPLATMVFGDANVTAGRDIFVNGVPGRAGTVRSCNSCHGNGGALDANGNNRQRDTGVAKRADAPACVGIAPGDGGFGATPVVSSGFTAPCAAVATFRGNGQFNTPPIIEAADTPPFFHNNSALTLEESIIHYTGEAFNNSPAGNGNAFVLSATQVNQLSAMMRALNAKENLRNGIAIDNRAIAEANNRSIASIREAASETRDALRVINQSPVAIYRGSGISTLLIAALASEQSALTVTGAARDALLRQAVRRKTAALARF